MENGYYTYVLQSLKDGKKYTGYTQDLKLRFERHQSGYVDPVEFTEGGTPEELFHGVDYLGYGACPIENKYGVHRLCRWRIDIPIRSATAQAVNTIQKW